MNPEYVSRRQVKHSLIAAIAAVSISGCSSSEEATSRPTFGEVCNPGVGFVENIWVGGDNVSVQLPWNGADGEIADRVYCNYQSLPSPPIASLRLWRDHEVEGSVDNTGDAEVISVDGVEVSIVDIDSQPNLLTTVGEWRGEFSLVLPSSRKGISHATDAQLKHAGEVLVDALRTAAGVPIDR